MSLLQVVRIALRALYRNKMRSTLTGLGIVIGVGAVIAMVAIGEGAKARVEETFSAMGTNLLIVVPGSSSIGGFQGGAGTQASLTWDDLTAIQTELRSVRRAAPMIRTPGIVQSDEQNWSTALTGTTPDYFELRTWPIAHGRALTPSDVEAGTKVVLLGLTVAEKLFGPNSDPLGQTVRIRKIPFQVVGVLAKKGQSPMGQDYDDVVAMPVTTFQSKIQGGLSKFLSGSIFVGVRSAEETGRTQAQITSLLRDRHKIPQGADDDFSIRNLSEIAAAQEQGTKVLTTLLASIAAVSLLVGGIGVMNIMLVSVTERTREIGIRMAVGARPRDILLQFLVEALTLSVAGGLIGVAIGLAAAFELASAFGWPLVVRPDIVLVSVSFAAAVGIVFGLYPARKASRLDPIEALRYE